MVSFNHNNKGDYKMFNPKEYSEMELRNLDSVQFTGWAGNEQHFYFKGSDGKLAFGYVIAR